MMMKTSVLTVFKPLFLAVLLIFLAGCIKNSDNTPPSITMNGYNPVTVCVGTPYTDAGATAFDETDGDVTDKIQVSVDVDTSQPGEGTVTYEVEDAAGNKATAIREVIVIFCD